MIEPVPMLHIIKLPYLRHYVSHQITPNTILSLIPMYLLFFNFILDMILLFFLFLGEVLIGDFSKCNFLGVYQIFLDLQLLAINCLFHMGNLSKALEIMGHTYL